MQAEPSQRHAASISTSNVSRLSYAQKIKKHLTHPSTTRANTMAKINSPNQRLSWTGAHVTSFGHLSIRSLCFKKRRILISIFRGYDQVCLFVHTIRIGGHIASSSTPMD
uniref:Uncharacterized protein n=1 Tax=Caenorhabditis japonica TaxID=281687 RepID=A0A8R1EUN5_CAEJA